MMSQNSISEKELEQIDAWWRTANYISVAQMYLKDNPLLRQPIQKEPSS